MNPFHKQLSQLKPLERANLVVKSKVIQLPLQDSTKEEVAQAIKVVTTANRGENVDFFEHVTAYKKLILDQFRHREPHAEATKHITWGLSRSLAGIGETLPVDGRSRRSAATSRSSRLPGEIFVELGLAIKQGSALQQDHGHRTPRTPSRPSTSRTRAAYAGGSYEVTNPIPAGPRRRCSLKPPSAASARRPRIR